MELSDYLAVARKRWISIAALSVVGLVLGLGISLMTTPMYTASTQLYVSVQGGSSTSEMAQGANFTRQQVASYTKIVTSPLVLGPVIDDLGLDIRASELASRVTSDSPINSSLVNITVADSSPAVAAALANAIASEFRDVVAELERPTDGSPSAVRLTVVRDAAAPTSPSEPNIQLNTLLGLLLGTALGIGIAILRELLDTGVRSEADLPKVTQVPVVGTILYDDDSTARPLIVQTDPHSTRAEEFRRLRTNVQFLNVASRPSSIVVTSSIPGEGKSTTTINLAITLAEAGNRVALVDADLRRPTVAKYLGLEGAAGLTTILIGRARLADVVQSWGNGNLTVIPSGQIPPNPSELLGSQAMSTLVRELVAAYDVVLIDTPPLLPVTDAAVLAKVAGGVLVVVGAGKINRNQLSAALGALSSVGAKTLGVVVNREPRRRTSAYGYYRYDSTETTRQAGKNRGKQTPRRAARGRTEARPSAGLRPGGSELREGPSAVAWPAVRSGGTSPGQPQGGSSPHHQPGRN
ncbi:polysaccharide biosynthesis tyrosine autokinase [Cellulomonas sp. KH9]|uniref:polysaccharide biosynthesis tyrosine autokinase n=1 Tax=Cellulomonas sp. KH9 TaxID=1855324 RepID=UPI0008E086A1|nr:polysaccharide biosynthesis tyrosine autokinase [Cellulomonas sp. KH9]SFK18376.1 capsular exopolysaccharide family [Cellulomonas sp. KH9]